MDKLYDFNNPIFKKHFIYKRLASEHLDLLEIQDDRIEIEVSSTIGPLKIPNQYQITYHISTIVGINDDQSPILGNKHQVEISLPKRYPLESAKIYTKTPVWHPNIQFHGKFQGRICGNTQNFGKGYSLAQLVLRIADILSYKNYHAEHTHPFPEDGKVADWVISYAEPNGLVHKEKGLLVEMTKPTKSLKIKSSSKVEPPKPKLKFKSRE